jgi:hypothetical protein
MMSKIEAWGKQIKIFIAWLLVSALGAWLFVVTREAMLSVLSTFYVGDSARRAWRVRFVDRVYFIIAGLIYLIFIFAIDGYLRDGLPKHDVLRRLARVLGIQLLALFPLDLTTYLLQRSLLGQWAIVVLVVEILGGAAFLFYSVRAKRSKRDQRLGGA